MKKYRIIIFFVSVVIFWIMVHLSMVDFYKVKNFLNDFINVIKDQIHMNENRENVNVLEIPKIYLNGDITNMLTKDDERVVDFTYTSLNKNFKSKAKIKIQGSWSLSFEKKNYTIKLYDEDYKKLKMDFGWGKEYKYVLKANWLDKSHSRNIVSARIAGEASAKYGLFMDAPNNGSIDGFPVEVYSNNEFLGLYTLNIPKEEWLFALNEDNLNHLVFEGEDNNDVTYFNVEPTYGDWNLELGKENSYNLDKLVRLYNFINNSSDLEFYKKFNKYFNLDSVLNYYVLTQTLFFNDNLGKNMLLVTTDGKIWSTVLYDLDTSFGVDCAGTSIYSFDALIDFDKNKLFKRFEECFYEEIQNRYWDLRKDVLSLNNIIEKIDEFALSIPEESLKKESERWENIPGYDSQQMKEFIKKRIAYLDEFYFQ